MKIRPARLETDLPAIVHIINPYETNPVTAEQVRSFFEYNPPGHCITWVLLDPAFRRQGLAATLWEPLLPVMQAQSAARLEADVRDDDPVGLGFAERRGFTIHHHIFRSTLDLASFDESPYLPILEHLQAEGLRFCPLADFPDTPETHHTLFVLNSAISADIPNQDDRQPGPGGEPDHEQEHQADTLPQGDGEDFATQVGDQARPDDAAQAGGQRTNSKEDANG
jgi:GNAT superfamily N-acetyltransferase